MPTPADGNLVRFLGWPRGVNNRQRETDGGGFDRDSGYRNDWLRAAQNVDISESGNLLRREGYSLFAAGVAHSLWSSPELNYGLAVIDGWLSLVDSLGAAPLLEVTSSRPVSYCAVNGEVYWSNGEELGRIATDATAVHWGLPVPAAPLVTVGAGTLPAGRYLVSCTCLDAEGAEGGASEPVEVDVPEGGGLVVEVPPGAPASVERVAVYVSHPNGRDLYRVARADPGAVVAVGVSDLGRGALLDTQDFRPPRPGHIVRYLAGRIYTARGDAVFFTEPLRYGLCRPSQGAFLFPAPPQLVEPSTDGLYVAHEGRTVFIYGTDPYDVREVHVGAFGAVRGTASLVPGSRLGAAVDFVPVWWTDRGVLVAGMPGGQLEMLTEDRLGVPRVEAGATLLREHEGLSQIVSTLRRPGETNTMGASDSVVAEVRRNCVKLN